MKKCVRFAAVKKLFPSAHIEPRRGTLAQAVDYCTKEDTRVDGPWHLGEPWPTDSKGRVAGATKKSALAEACSKLAEGASMSSIVAEMPATYAVFHRGLLALQTALLLRSTPVYSSISVISLWGPTWTGKTRAAIELGTRLYGQNEVYIMNRSNSDNCWFDGYMGEKVIIFDDYTGWLRIAVLLRLCDGYRKRIEIKSGFTVAQWKLAIFTSNNSPHHWYQEGLAAHMAPMLRRIDYCTEIDRPVYPDMTLHPEYGHRADSACAELLHSMARALHVSKSELEARPPSYDSSFFSEDIPVEKPAEEAPTVYMADAFCDSGDDRALNSLIQASEEGAFDTVMSDTEMLQRAYHHKVHLCRCCNMTAKLYLRQFLQITEGTLNDVFNNVIYDTLTQ